MDKSGAQFSYSLLDAYLDLHRDIKELKFCYLKVVQSRNIKDMAKLDLKNSLLPLTYEIERHFKDLERTDLSRLDQKDFDYGEQEFIRKTRIDVSALIKKMRKPLPIRIEYTKDDMQLDVEISRQLGEQKIFEEEALGMDRLQAVNQVFLFIQTVLNRDSGDWIDKRAEIDAKLGELKCALFAEKIKVYRVEHGELAFKTISALKKQIEHCKSHSGRMHVLAEDEAPLATSNDDDLYVFRSPSHDYTIYLTKKQKRPSQLRLKISLLRDEDPEAIQYAGRIEGRVELGSDAQSFCIIDQDRRAPKKDTARVSEVLGAIDPFLKNTEILEIYLFLQKFFEENKTDIENRQHKQDELRIRRIIKGMDEIF